MTEEAIFSLRSLGCEVEPCGSRVTCSPPPSDTDQDYLVIVPDNEATVGKVVNNLSGLGFVWEGNDHYQNAMANDFMSWRKDDTNFIVTSNDAFATRHRAATHVCTRLNLMSKQDRIALFQAVLYGNQWDGKGAAPSQPKQLEIKEEEIAF